MKALLKQQASRIEQLQKLSAEDTWQLERQSKLIERYKEALKFYADDSNYSQELIDKLNSSKARETLKEEINPAQGS